MKNLTFVALAVASWLLVSCGVPIGTKPGDGTVLLADSRFVGTFERTFSGIDQNYNDVDQTIELVFDGTNKVRMTNTWQAPSHLDDSILHSGDFVGDSDITLLEFQIESGTYRIREWANSNVAWSSWYAYAFSLSDNSMLDLKSFSSYKPSNGTSCYFFK